MIPLYIPQCGDCKFCLSPKTNLCQKIRLGNEPLSFIVDGSCEVSFIFLELRKVEVRCRMERRGLLAKEKLWLISWAAVLLASTLWLLPFHFAKYSFFNQNFLRKFKLLILKAIFHYYERFQKRLLWKKYVFLVAAFPLVAVPL